MNPQKLTELKRAERTRIGNAFSDLGQFAVTYYRADNGQYPGGRTYCLKFDRGLLLRLFDSKMDEPDKIDWDSRVIRLIGQRYQDGYILDIDPGDSPSRKYVNVIMVANRRAQDITAINLDGMQLKRTEPQDALNMLWRDLDLAERRIVELRLDFEHADSIEFTFELSRENEVPQLANILTGRGVW